jgi:hypothetical protein
LSVASKLASLFRRDLSRLLDQLRAIPSDDALWAAPPGVTNAAGTLALHLEGNLREYIGRQLGGTRSTRRSFSMSPCKPENFSCTCTGI